MMQRRMGDTIRSHIQHTAARILLSIFVLLMYFYIVRPARIVLSRRAFRQLKKLHHPGASYTTTMRSGALLITYHSLGKDKNLEYRPQLGFFFVISLLGLIFITYKTRYYLILTGIHIAASLLAYVALLTGASGYAIGFLLTDIIDAYLIPAISLLIVLLAFDNSRGRRGKADSQ